MTLVYAEIITIGDELLIGQVVDTNSAFIASELNRVGISVRKLLSIPDKANDIIDTLDETIQRSNIVIITGGLGPTSDDITKLTLTNYFNGRLIEDATVLRDIEAFFRMRGMLISERNRKQAEIPDVCKPLRNKNGTAPGMLFNKDGKLIFSLPGVPFEMKALLLDEVIPFIQKHFILPVKIHSTILTVGLSESYTADHIKDWEESLGPEYGLAYLPSPGVLRLRLSISGDNTDQLNRQLIDKMNELSVLLGANHVFGFDDETLQQVIGNLLKVTHSSLSLAESCTGGYIAHLVTSVPGASEYFKGSVTAYANEAKTGILKVPPDIIENDGAVSEAAVIKMAAGTKELFNTDYSIATSGIAGPGGGSEAKPVGTTWIAIATPVGVTAQKFLFGDHRERNITRASLTALNMLRLQIISQHKK
jgi:nicotinamide-nucleotide amidase